MDRPQWEVADVFRRYGDAYRAAAGRALPAPQRRVMTAIETCRTAALGGHVERCDACAHERIAYNSCGNRHCPKCQSLARATWIARRAAELLPTEYFHVVFTVPDGVAALALANKVLLYNLLFRTTADTLRTIAADPQHLGAEIGFFAVLHTWGQALTLHPHLHCVVPGGGLSADGTQWIPCRPGFFLPVRVLSRLFRGRFLAALQQAYDTGALQVVGTLASLREPAAWAAHLATLRAVEWVVYAKPPFAGPAQVLDYVGRYTHRVAITNHRLVDVTNDHVRFTYRDYRDADTQPPKVLTLTASEFIRRFLLHVVPSGFHRIRHYGLLSARHRRTKLAQCRAALAVPTSDVPVPRTADYRDQVEGLTGRSLRTCPRCEHGQMIRVGTVQMDARAPCPVDSS